MMSIYTIVTTGSVQKLVNENGDQVDWLDDEYRTWLGQGNMPDAVVEPEDEL
jgi:hypothetical protein